jgi:N-methylhydantoinase B
MVAFLSGRDPRRGGAPFLYVMPHAGGWGAFEGADGEDGLINNVNGGFKDYPVEVFETKYPAVIRGYGFRPDTGGPGRFRGGCRWGRRPADVTTDQGDDVMGDFRDAGRTFTSPLRDGDPGALTVTPTITTRQN